MNFDPAGTGLTGKFAKRYHFEDMPDQVGKTAIVTGGSAGIGQSIALAMALAGATVHFTSTTPEHGESTLQAIKEKLAESDRPASKSGKVFYHQLDQGTFSQVIDFAEKMNKELDPEGDDSKGLDYLLCNAGIGVAKLQDTADGLPCHFQVNHLAHMLMCHLLTPLLEKTSQLPRNKGKKGAVRIVMQASQQHKLAPGDIKFENLQEIEADLGGNGNYARSKLMNILFAKEFSARRLIPAPISSNVVILSVHPGAVATTQEHAAQEAYPILGSILTVASKVLFMAPEQGAESLLWAATSPKVQEEGAEKYQGCYLTQPDDELGWETNQAKDVELAKRLWKISVQVIKDKAGVTIDY